MAKIDFDIVVVGKDFSNSSQDSIQGSADDLWVKVIYELGSDSEI
jgi:hypothetical protein